MSRFTDLTGSLYRGDVSFDFVGRRRQWYAVSGVILVVAIGALVFRGLNFGIEFEGGSVFTVTTETCTVTQARDAFGATKVTTIEPIVTEVSGSAGRSVQVQTVALNGTQSALVADSLATACNV